MAKRISNPPPPVKDKPPYPLTVKQDDYLALLAQVEALRGAIEKWQATDDSRLLADALAATPQHHLRELRADAVLDAVKSCAIVKCFEVPCISVYGLNQYAEQIRKGEVK